MGLCYSIRTPLGGSFYVVKANGYATGVFSSRGLARKLEEDVAFRVLAAGNFPSHRTICEFRRRHLSGSRNC